MAPETPRLRASSATSTLPCSATRSRITVRLSARCTSRNVTQSVQVKCAVTAHVRNFLHLCGVLLTPNRGQLTFGAHEPRSSDAPDCAESRSSRAGRGAQQHLERGGSVMATGRQTTEQAAGRHRRVVPDPTTAMCASPPGRGRPDWRPSPWCWPVAAAVEVRRAGARAQTRGVTITVALASDPPPQAGAGRVQAADRDHGQVGEHRLGQPADQDLGRRDGEDLFRRRHRRRLVPGRPAGQARLVLSDGHHGGHEGDGRRRAAAGVVHQWRPCRRHPLRRLVHGHHGQHRDVQEGRRDRDADDDRDSTPAI